MMQLKDAQAIAVSVGNTLLPYCDRLNIAGSIRRRKPEVKDIEIVCLPKQIEQGQASMFDTGPLPTIVNPEFSQLVMSLGEVVKGKPDGKYMQIKLSAGIVLDLFMPDTFDYYRQYAIRTGSADYSAKIIAGGWKKLGWCGSDQGLRRTRDCIEIKDGNSGKSKWKCVTVNAEKPPVWDSEEAFFAWLQVPYLKPEQRSL